MERDGGVYKIPCVVNGLKLKMVFDTGASRVCLSETVAQMMLENDYLLPNDIKGYSQSQVADGRIVDNTEVVLRKIEIGGKTLCDVEAVVISGQSAPLLLGQSAISKLGRVSLKEDQLIINEYKSNVRTKDSYTDEEIDRIIEEAVAYYNEDSYEMAVEKYKIAYENNALSNWGISYYADCLRILNRNEEALKLYLLLYDWNETLDSYYKMWYYYSLQRCYENLGEHEESIKYGQLALRLADYSSFECFIGTVHYISLSYVNNGDSFTAHYFIEKQIKKYLEFMEIEAADAWNKGYRDPILSNLYYSLYLLIEDRYQSEKFASISAAWGKKEAIETCKKYDIEYLTKPKDYEY